MSISLLCLPPHFQQTVEHFNFWPRWNNKEPLYPPSWSNQNVDKTYEEVVFKTLSGNQNISRRWESEVSPKIMPAPFLAFPAVAQGWWSRRRSQEGISRPSELRIQDDQSSRGSKEMREFHRERILEMFRVPLKNSAESCSWCKATKKAGERTTGKN